ncbi:NAD(P)-binding protein [Streptomyces sp. NPDC059861]|uniref:NAD(P)-binding protein n=1 Tax=Streptomyces sp. NPDC059861 TaxID=3346974 RepID=UPI00365B8CC6
MYAVQRQVPSLLGGRCTRTRPTLIRKAGRNRISGIPGDVFSSKVHCEENSMQEFDYVLVGAGSAGCVVAARLLQETDARVLVLEAGDGRTMPRASYAPSSG